MNSPDSFEKTPVLLRDIRCDTFETVVSTIDSLYPEFSPILKEVYPTAESFARTGYFGGPRTVSWIDKLDVLLESNRRGFNESGANLVVNLEAMRAVSTKKTGFDQASLEHDELEGWKAAFSDYYIDPYGCVNDIADALRRNITEFCARPGHYTAPYTCIVTSSMMGKSRLMKEVATVIPTVYMCLGTNRTFYPHPTKVVIEWIRGGVEGMGYWHPSDKDFLVPTLKYSAFLLALIQKLPDLVSEYQDEKDYSWMWKFFAEPPNSCEKTNDFWRKVTGQATAILRANSFPSDKSSHESLPQKLLTPWISSTSPRYSRLETPSTPHTLQKVQSSAPETPSPSRTVQSSGTEIPSTPRTQSQKVQKNTISAESARSYLAEQLGADLRDAYAALKEAFNAVTDKDFNMLFIFDEARYLTDTSAIDGKRVPAGVDHQDEPDIAPEKLTDPNIVTECFPFTNFHALRRALHLFMQTRWSTRSLNSPVPRIFGLMTDTSSRLTNFQPALLEDNSLKINQLPPMGSAQFDPIFTFTSIDVHSRMSNNPMCVSDVDEVAHIERLLKFGRPGWWGIYHHFPKKNMLELAAVKLTGMQHPSDKLFGIPLGAAADHKTKLRLFAVLAPRLAITAGPYTREAAEAVASHLAVVVNADHHRHFLKTVYSSEPIVATAAASLTKRMNGWTNTLCALTSYIQTGIVDAGFRGELLTKILCLMAVDESMRNVVLRSSSYWQYAIPVKVSVFLDNLITAPPNFKRFTDALRATPINDERLNRFLDGHVFFNHFVRMEEKLTMPLIVQAWNRGAALMCKINTALIDHVIPVMLANTHGSPPDFGPLYDDWDEKQVEEARQHVSYIVINSRNWTDAKNWTTTYITANNSNITDCMDPPGTVNYKLSMTIMQEFGPRQIQEDHITIFPSRGRKKPFEDTTQLHVILKELSDQTYTAFQKNYIHPLAQEYLEALRVASGNYHDGVDNKLNSIRRDNMPVMLGDYTTTSKDTWRIFQQDRMQVDE